MNNEYLYEEKLISNCKRDIDILISYNAKRSIYRTGKYAIYAVANKLPNRVRGILTAYVVKKYKVKYICYDIIRDIQN